MVHPVRPFPGSVTWQRAMSVQLVSVLQPTYGHIERDPSQAPSANGDVHRRRPQGYSDWSFTLQTVTCLAYADGALYVGLDTGVVKIYNYIDAPQPNSNGDLSELSK